MIVKNDVMLKRRSRDVRIGSKTKKNPGPRRSTRMLTGHEKSDHEMGDFMVGKRTSVSVALVAEDGDHIGIVALRGRVRVVRGRTDSEFTPTNRRDTCLPLIDDVEVEVCHLLLGAVPFSIALQR